MTDIKEKFRKTIFELIQSPNLKVKLAHQPAYAAYHIQDTITVDAMDFALFMECSRLDAHVFVRGISRKYCYTTGEYCIPMTESNENQELLDFWVDNNIVNVTIVNKKDFFVTKKELL